MNQFQAAGGPGFVLRELLDAGCLHADVRTVDDARPARLRARARLQRGDAAALARRCPRQRRRHHRAPGGATRSRPPAACKLLQGNLGRAVIKIARCPRTATSIEAPARGVRQPGGAAGGASRPASCERDFVAVVRFQGPRANGMPELHKLTPPLAVLQGKGFKVALVTDGRMSGASGKVPAAIHVSPEALAGGAAGQGARRRRDPPRRRRRHARRVGRRRPLGRARAERDRPTPGRATTRTASAASCSAACAATSTAPSRAPAPGCEGHTMIEHAVDSSPSGR